MTRIAIALGLAALAPAIAAQERTPAAGGAPPGLDREKMWWAPTAEDWKRPVLVTFQRTWDDAVAVSRETGKPILVCVNMDGEIASEHYAGVRYRQSEIAALYEPYVCVIASVYRHNPRDFDEAGRRILCPRFGSVTCSEHIWIEPILYEKFMDGRRIAPRHIMVELDGAETYDVYYAWDTDSVFQAIQDGIANRQSVAKTIIRGDRPIVERVASRDIQDRNAVESAYQQGDRDLKRSLLQAALESGDAVPLDLLRLAVRGLDLELAELARRALAQSGSADAVDLINDALRVPLNASDRDELIGALDRLGGSSPRARTLAVVHRGLAGRSSEVDVEGWSKALAGSLEGGGTYAPASDWSALEQRIDTQAAASDTRPEDAAARLELAEASLELAIDPKTAQILAADRRTRSDYARLMFEDAHRAAVQAEELGAAGWRVNAVIGLSAYYLGNVEEAYARAEAAAGDIPSGAEEWSAIATLALFAEARQKAIAEAVREKKEWPGQWLTDVNAAYSVIARHPIGTDAHVAAHHDFLKSLGALGPASRVLDEGLARFPDSRPLHDRLRARILEEKGVEGLETAYEERLRQPDAAKNLEWFAGYASLVAAEFHRRAGNGPEALAAYDRAIAHYERNIEKNPETRATADHYVALALAGRARLAFETGDHERAVAELLASLERKPEAAATQDGLNLSPADTARTLLARLKDLDLDDLVTRLETALGKLDPELLRLPAYERDGPPGERRAGRRGRTQPGG